MNINKKNKPRLQVIESLLYWEGKVHRNDLIEKLGISAPQASLDLKEYRALAPENISYDPSTRNYLARENFVPQVYEPDAYHYLGELMRCGQDHMNQFNPALGTLPNNTSITILNDALEADTIRKVVLSMKRKGKIKIEYQGIAKQAEVTNRWIVPKLIFFDGMRWQIRAYCLMRNDYRTFTLSRILKVNKVDFSPYQPPLDTKWELKTKIILVPGDELTPEQKKVIARIYDFVDNEKEVEIETELLPYFLLANRLFPFYSGAYIKIKNQQEIEEIIKNKDLFLY